MKDDLDRKFISFILYILKFFIIYIFLFCDYNNFKEIIIFDYEVRLVMLGLI